MKILRLLVAFFGAVFATGAQAAPSSGSGLALLESLVGGVWLATLPTPEDQSPLQIELRFAWTNNHQAIRFDSAFRRGERRQPYTDGIYAWNAAKQRVAIFYADASGSLTEGLITVEGDTLVNDLTSTSADGKTEPIRVRLTKEGTEVFTNAIFLLKEGEWVPFVTVRYERKQ